ncbi:MAG: hypothetical protein KC493_04090 [Bacteriovoracaceae bacterium]|nr:hypothetical protein [Bacteriovoracaceae bacterium]
MKKLFKNKIFLFSLFNIVIVGALYQRCSMQEQGKKWPMKGLKEEEKLTPPKQDPAARIKLVPTTLKTPSPEQKERILKYAMFVDEIKSFDKASIKQLDTLLNKAYTFIPKKEDLNKNKTDHVHHIPVEVKLTGEFIGKLVTETNSNKSLLPRSNKFYKRCSSDDSFPTTVRALCLSHYILTSRKLNIDINLKEFPARVVELSKLTLQLEE